MREAKRRKAHANHCTRFERGDASQRDAPAFRRFAAALPLAGLPPTGFNSGPRFLGRRPDAEQPAFPILQSSELLAGRSLCRPGGVRVARERIANPRAGTALAPLSGVPSRRRPSMSEIRYRVPEIGTYVNEKATCAWRNESRNYSLRSRGITDIGRHRSWMAWSRFGPGTDICSNAGDGTAIHLSAPGAVRHDVAHQVAHVVLQISDDVLDDVSNRDHAHDLARVQHW